MVDILLIHITTSFINWGARSSDPQLGQYYIAEYAHRNGFNVKIKRYNSNEPIISSISDLLVDLKCRVVGFYVDSENLWTIRRIIYDIKTNVPGTIAFIGGPQVTGDVQQCLKRIIDADFAIVGEGEITTTELLQNQFNYKNSDILGVAYLDGNGKFHYSGSRPQPRDLDIYPFPIRERYSLDENTRFNQILTGRGCIGKCAFCFEGSKVNNILRLRSVKSVCDEIDYLVQRLPQDSYITFLDDTFIINPKRTEAICNWMIDKYQGKIKWYCEARVDILLKNIDLLPLMKKAGLIRIQLGGESGNQGVLDAYNKGMIIEDLKLVVQKIYEAGIDSVYLNYIVGGAFETLETFNDTLSLVCELMEIAPCCAEVGCSMLAPYVGSPIYNNPEKFGLKILDKELISGPGSSTAFVETKELSRAKIVQLNDTFERTISEKCHQLIPQISYEAILRQYELDSKYNVNTFWYTEFSKVVTIYNYFTGVIKHNLYSIRNVEYEILLNSVPFRTEDPISDGEKFYRRVYGQKLIENTDLENSVIFLSAGKVAYWEIIEILKRKYPDNENLENEVLDIYKQLDKEYMIVWKTMN